MRITRRYSRRRYFNLNRRGRRTRGQTRRLLQIWGTALAALLVLVLAALLLRVGTGARPGFEKGDLLVCVNGDGRVEFYWPEATSDSALYRVDFTCGTDGTERVTRISHDASFGASPIQAGERVEIRVWAVADGKSLLGKPKEVKSWKSFHARLTVPETPEAPEVTGTLEDGAASLRWEGTGDVYAVFRDYEAFSDLAATTREREAAIPLEGETSLRQFAVRAGWKKWGYVLCGPAAHPAAAPPVTAPGEALPQEGALNLTYQETSPRVYALEWNGLQCAEYQVQRWTGEAWETLARLTPRAHMRCDLGRLGSGSWNRFRVAGIDGGGQATKTEEVSFYASVSPLYAAIWPIEDMTFRENPGGTRIGAIPGGASLCVLAEEGHWFRVRYGGEYGWIDSRYCMIDLPEYVGDYCSYDITNSYDSLFAVHGADIKNVTHTVLPGYESVRLADGSFLVPYLYPCAQKLLTAAQAAQADGLRLKIYEAFRPKQATRYSYDTTERQMNDPVSGGGTLSQLMTDNGRFNLGSFLARTISSHNRGIALDLTLEKLDGGGELEMQSTIHDLSWYSETYLNTVNAKLLAGYMTAVGMIGLSSEWWHFQDDQTREAIKLKNALDQGVSPEGWLQDDGGWRYRQADGTFVRSGERTVDGRLYAFDAEGYAAP